jgi:cytochrome P450
VSPRAELDLDLYTDQAILDPHPGYRAIRERAAAVWLLAHQVWALGRFEDVRAALRADGALVSGRGVALSALVNDMSSTITACTAAPAATSRSSSSSHSCGPWSRACAGSK